MTKSNTKIIRESIIISLVVIFGQLIMLPIFLIMINSNFGKLSFEFYYILSFAIPCVYIYKSQRIANDISTFNYKLESLRNILLLLIATLIIQNYIISPLINLIEFPFFINSLNSINQNTESIIFNFSFAILCLAPLIEEFIFRGIIQKNLQSKISVRKAIVITSILFGIVHLNPWQFISAFTISLFIGWVYYRTNNIVNCILIHFFNNAISNINWNHIETTHFNTQSIIIFLGALLILGTCIFILNNNLNSYPKTIYSKKNNT
jgi:membrane protease YdiL (CAAX protease family)